MAEVRYSDARSLSFFLSLGDKRLIVMCVCVSYFSSSLAWIYCVLLLVACAWRVNTLLYNCTAEPDPQSVKVVVYFVHISSYGFNNINVRIKS